jgi:hypothetical protein
VSGTLLRSGGAKGAANGEALVDVHSAREEDTCGVLGDCLRRTALYDESLKCGKHFVTTSQSFFVIGKCYTCCHADLGRGALSVA